MCCSKQSSVHHTQCERHHPCAVSYGSRDVLVCSRKAPHSKCQAAQSAWPLTGVVTQDPRNEGEWLHCSDYSNGGPAFVPDEAASDTVEILAEYRREDIKGAAAVKCQVRFSFCSGMFTAIFAITLPAGLHDKIGLPYLLSFALMLQLANKQYNAKDY